jgi:hypothetical protein
MDYYELQEWAKSNGSSSTDQQPVDEELFDTGATLKKDDLKRYQYLNPIRDYMIERKGVDYKDKEADEVVEDFVDHMRYFNANTVSTAGEVRFISKADDNRKAKAKKAYQIYDQLGNVFVNDGLMGAVDGIKDYVFAAAKDPTNYLGLLTGGVARAGAAGISLTGKQVLKAAVRQAGKEALRSGATREAAKEAAQRAGIEAARRAVAKGMTTKAAGKVNQQVAKRVANEGRRALAKDAMAKKQAELFETAATRSLKQTVALDASAAVMQDIMAQNVMLDVGAQEEYSLLQTGFSSVLGGVAGAAQLGFGKFRGASDLNETGSALDKVTNNIIEEYTPMLDKEAAKGASKTVMKEVEDWNAKVARGSAYSLDTMPSELIKNIMIGSDGKSGLAKVFKDSGFKIGREKHLSDVMTNVARSMPQEELVRINKELKKYTGIQLGDLSGTQITIGDMLAKKINEAGKTLNVMSQVRKTLDAGIVASNDKMAAALDEIEAKEAVAKELKKADKLRYGQSVWKRLLVSSPATTAVNVAGFSQYYIGSTLADLFNATALMTKGLGQSAYNREAANESFRQARAYVVMQGQKMRNLLDPYTTHDVYMEFLDNNQDLQKILFETMAGGIEATATRYGLDPNSKVFNNIEAFAKAANQITGVRIQDSFTKSQMFMTEMDKYLRLNKKTTLKEALSAEENIIDDTVLQGALDTTLKSVFAKDYTTAEQGELIRTTARFVETISNTPGLGTILPFGRFFNNVVATTYQWSPLAAPEHLFKFAKRIAKQEGTAVSERDAFARMAVGTTGLLMAMDYDKERRAKGLGIYEIDAGGGTIVDAKNTFPFSIFLAAGRVLNMMRNGEEVPREVLQEIGTQVGVGQLARDAQFGNDINNLLDILINNDQGARGASIDGFYKVAGNFLSGVTRPLDAVNKTIGFAMGTDTAKDVRQARGFDVFTQSSTKYIDNILEAFIDKTDAITGEELRVATREGELYDANPFARIFGLTIKPGRTATEKAYSMAEMFPWTANERTNVPAYDKAFNGLLAPILEAQTQRLIDTPAFEKANLTGKREMLKTLMSDMKRHVRKEMQEGYAGGTNARLRMAAKLDTKGTKEIRREAQKLLKATYGITGSPRDYNFNELEIYAEFIDYLEDMYEEVGKI